VRRQIDPGLARHLDGLAKMRHCLLKGAVAERLLAGLAKPRNGGFAEACLDTVMRRDSGLLSSISANWLSRILAG
jgi:hypothetical protein